MAVRHGGRDDKLSYCYSMQDQEEGNGREQEGTAGIIGRGMLFLVWLL